jgi:E-phenylitaconyl-CoA hydratase
VLRWALMGNEERITAPTALRLGLVTEVVTRESLRERAREIALSIAGRNPKAIQGTVRAIWESLDVTRTPALNTGIAYTLIGNYPSNPPPPRDKSETQYR